MANYKWLYDARGHRTTQVEVADLDNEIIVKSTQNVAPLIRENKMLQENHRSGGHRKLAARIPLVVWNKAVREGWAYDQNQWKKYLNDPDNKKFRVWEGRL